MRRSSIRFRHTRCIRSVENMEGMPRINLEDSLDKILGFAIPVNFCHN